MRFPSRLNQQLKLEKSKGHYEAMYQGNVLTVNVEMIINATHPDICRNQRIIYRISTFQCKRYIKMIANSSKIKQKKELQKYTIYEKNVGVWKCAFTTLLTILMCRILHNVRSLILLLSQLVLLE